MSNPVRIALFLMTSNNDYQTLLKEGCRKAARKYQFSVREQSAQNDVERQLAQIRECLAEPEAIRPRALIVFPVIESLLRPAAEDAARLGVAFVMLNRSCTYMEELRGRYPKVPIVSVMPDQRDIGRIQGQQFARLLPGGGELLYIQGTFHTSAARMRLEGVRESIEGLNIRMVMEQGDWSSASGTAAAQRWLKARVSAARLRSVVGAQNDDMAMGARAALQAAALELDQPELAEIPVTGCDGTVSQGQSWVSTKDLRATVVMPPTASKAVEVIALALSSGKAPTSDVSVAERPASFPALQLIGTPEVPQSSPRLPSPRVRTSFLRS